MSNERNYKYLYKINSPTDLKSILRTELPTVCDELRSFIIDEVSKNPGHLGSSLGVVELTVALHYVYNTPYDRIVWDVGHQAYGHKILTGRREQFHTNRKFKGLCGFPLPSESEYDAFGVGHSSTAISAALGMSVAALKKGENRHVVAVVGDGAMTGGLAFEGLNNTSMVDNDMLIILNDNQMAIDPIHGGFTQYLIDITTSKTYNRLRYKAYKTLKRLNLISDKAKNRIITFNNTIKAALTKQNNIFEGLNIRYFGPVDGHNVDELVKILTDIKEFKGPKVLHCITQKGKGYMPAEKSVTEWHAPGKFNVETGERTIVTSDTLTAPLFQDVFGETLLELAKINERIIAITPAMPSGCSMSIMQQVLPERVYDVGIAEGHAVTFSAGLVKDGMIPVCNIYSSFMQRAYDNIIHDVALQKLPVVFCIDRAGIVGSDGATHHGIFDLAYLRCIPNMVIAAPSNEHELRNLMYTAVNYKDGPFAIRYPRGKGFLVDWKNTMVEVPIGKSVKLKDGNKIAVLALGSMLHPVQEAIRVIESSSNHKIGLFDMRYVKPLDKNLLLEIASEYTHVITVEDGVVSGGFGSAVLEFFAEKSIHLQVKLIGINDVFVEHGTPEELYHMLGLDAVGLQHSIEKVIRDFQM